MGNVQRAVPDPTQRSFGAVQSNPERRENTDVSHEHGHKADVVRSAGDSIFNHRDNDRHQREPVGTQFSAGNESFTSSGGDKGQHAGAERVLVATKNSDSTQRRDKKGGYQSDELRRVGQ